jgi:hypothetical protein
MNMMLRIFTAALVAAPWAATVEAADPQLLGLVMPDVKVIAGVNVDQAKASTFGQYLITQILTNQHLEQVVVQTGFDPTQDLDELLLASNGAASNASHLVLARGTFNGSVIDGAAAAAGATSEVYNGVTIMENLKHGDGFAFLSGTIAVAGDVASVKAAIGRQTAPSTLPPALLAAVNQLSSTEDAWGFSEVPPPAIKPPANSNLPTVPSTVFQNIQQSSGGVKFGSPVTLNAQFLLDTPANATALANVLQFLLNLGEMKEQQNAQAAAALKTIEIAASATAVSVTASIPEAQLEALAQMMQHTQTSPNLRRPKAQGQQRF